MSLVTASDVNMNLSWVVEWKCELSTGIKGEFLPLYEAENVCQFIPSCKLLSTTFAIVNVSSQLPALSLMYPFIWSPAPAPPV